MNQKKVRKAVIPAAGLGTRLFPATKILKKELFPLIDQDGHAKPAMLIIVEEAIKAGITEIAIVVPAGETNSLAEFFSQPLSASLKAKLSPENLAYHDYILNLGEKISFIYQNSPEGYGHAIYCARKWLGNEPFLLLLGDHVYKSALPINCARQVIEIYEQLQKSTIGLTIMSGDIIQKAGCVTGNWQKPREIMELKQICEKPSLEYAQTHLQMPDMNKNEFLAVFGIYVLDSAIFGYLEREIKQNQRYKNEFQLTTSLEKMRAQEGMIGYLVKGQYFDIGMPQFYRQTVAEF